MLDVLRSIKKYYEKKEYDVLIIVRYLMGTAYLPQRLAKIGYNFFENFVPTSEYMFFLDASPKNLLKRVEKRRDKEMFETFDELVKIRKKALSLAKNWNVIDTTGDVEETFSHIEEILKIIDDKT